MSYLSKERTRNFRVCHHSRCSEQNLHFIEWNQVKQMTIFKPSMHCMILIRERSCYVWSGYAVYRGCEIWKKKFQKGKFSSWENCQKYTDSHDFWTKSRKMGQIFLFIALATLQKTSKTLQINDCFSLISVIICISAQGCLAHALFSVTRMSNLKNINSKLENSVKLFLWANFTDSWVSLEHIFPWWKNENKRVWDPREDLSKICKWE